MSGSPLRERLAVYVHEARSPVAALGAIDEAFARGELDAAERRQLAALAAAACRGLERIVLDAALASVRPAEVDPGLLLREAVQLAELGGARVEARVAPGLPRLLADPVRLRQALGNLLANALAHSPPEATVIAEAAVRRGEVLLRVSDAGPGIPPADQERIFAPGTRLDQSRPGSGLGLWIARTIVEAHGGTLTVTSAPGAGATFTIALPLPRPRAGGLPSR